MVAVKNPTYIGADPPTTPVPSVTPGETPDAYPAEPAEPEAVEVESPPTPPTEPEE